MNIKKALIIFSLLLLPVKGFAQFSNIDFAAFPPTSVEAATPLVMMSLSRDHQYFFTAYSDFSDLDPENNDGPETTYENNIEYFGYFDPNKCYTYNTGTQRFAPQSFQNTPFYCDDVTGDWSGNFLNWATMTRMDVVRKIFYGGFRSTDTATTTVLERAHLPFDAHSFAKYFNSADIPRLTPFDASNGVEWDGNGRVGDNVGFNDRVEGITICNTSPDDGPALSENSTAAPVMRVVRGNFSLWAANERWQCTWDDERGNNSNGNEPNPATGILDSGIDADSSDPNRFTDALTANGQEDRIVRIEVCNTVALIDLSVNAEDCREYPDGNFKPSGLLNQFGEEGLIEFGLMTGGFQANTEGGILRKNIRGFDDEVNVDTDGTFTGFPGIVSNMDALRMVGYEYGNGTYFQGNSPDECNFQQTDIQPNECFSWGNPISEILLEAVNYLTGGTETAAFDVDDQNRLQGVTNRGGGIEDVPGLSTEAWIDVLSADNQCAAVTQVVINASVSSFDENLTSAAALPGSPDIDGFTDQVGDIEGISGNNFFIGETAGDNDQFCTSKTVNNLSDARGICPEAPTVSGSYAAAGIAFYAATEDLRNFDGDQNIQTLGITLATNAPVINVPLGPVGSAQSINILPAYRLQVGTGGGGALVDFQIVQGHEETSPGSGIFTGQYYLNWEDSEQGGDFDNDVWGTLSYELNAAAGLIEITTNAVSETTGNGQLFGFITAGTTQDGFHAYSGALGADFTDTSPVDPLAPDNGGQVPGCNNCRALNEGGGQNGPQSYTFRIDTTGVLTEPLEPPLYYAAKYGFFNEFGGATGPDQQNEFDVQNNFTGEQTPDGVPDGFFAATSPQTLVEAVENALTAILAQGESAGSAAATLGNSDGSGGLIIQGVYFENLSSTDAGGEFTGEDVAWSGRLDSFFVDGNGFFREDSNGNGQLDDSTAVDNIFEYTFDVNTNTLMIERFTLDDVTQEFDPIDNLPVSIGLFDSNELLTVWSASELLSDLDNDTIDENRIYSSTVETTGPSRFIFTWIDDNGDGEVQNSEIVPFERDEVGDGSEFQGFLGFNGVDPDLNVQARNVVDFIRGKNDIPGFRNRDLSIEGGTPETLRLGDIVNSTPALVGTPIEAYDVLFGDTTYADFRDQYANRRNVVYVGGNDGLIHAFNAGFNSSTQAAEVVFDVTGTNNETAHPLGAELWAYAPKNLLPHLKFLTDPDYLHVFYADGEVSTFDVNIFPNDATHPGGWGTILVVGMRLGGGEINLGDIAGNGDDEITRSSYVILDVTDPEQPPVLLGEVSHDDLDHTTTKPTVVTRRVGGAGGNFNNLSGANNSWTLVFGSGPDNRVDFTSSTDATIFTLDLEVNNGSLANVDPTPFTIPNPGGEGAFVGSLATADWDPDFIDDVVYFGTVEQDITAATLDDPTGGLFRFLPDSGNINLMLDTDRPIASTPLPLVVEGQNFVYAGTGQFFQQSDAQIQDQEVYVGIREQDTGFTQQFIASQLLDITDIDIIQNFNADGDTTSIEAINGTSGLADSNGDGTVLFEELSEFILTGGSGTNGWIRFFNTTANASSERVISDSASIGTVLGFTAFTPDDDICSPTGGMSDIFVVDLVTGTASPELFFLDELTPATAAGGGSQVVPPSQFFGFSFVSDLSALPLEDGQIGFVGTSGLGGPSNFTGGSNPSIPVERINWREIEQ